MQIDLQMQERAKLWEIDKMQLRSQMDFQREEQMRSRKLDSIDSAIQQIDKEVLAGRMTEQEAYPIKQKLEISKTGVSVPISAFEGDEEGRTGVSPFWTEWLNEPADSKKRQYAEKKLAADARTGTVPWDLDPRYIRTQAAEESRVNRGIFLEPEDIDEFIGVGAAKLPLAGKQLDVGVRAEEGVTQSVTKGIEVEEGRIRVISPDGQTGTILESERQDYIDQGFTIVGEQKAFRGAGATGTWEEEPIIEAPVTKQVKKRKAAIGTIDWDYFLNKGFK
jgi:hypothetical protein